MKNLTETEKFAFIQMANGLREYMKGIQLLGDSAHSEYYKQLRENGAEIFSPDEAEKICRNLSGIIEN